MFIDTREKEKIKLEAQAHKAQSRNQPEKGAQTAQINRQPLRTSHQLVKTVIEGKKSEEAQMARQATILNARVPTMVRAPTMSTSKGHATLRTTLRQETIRSSAGTGTGMGTGMGTGTGTGTGTGGQNSVGSTALTQVDDKENGRSMKMEN